MFTAIINSWNNNQENVTAVLATGAGKTLPILLAASLQGSTTTIVITPFVALMQDFERRCKDVGVECARWSPDMPSRPRVIVLAAETIANSKRLADDLSYWIRDGNQLVDRIVFDEAHVLISAFYRNLDSLAHVLPAISCQKVFITATLPPSGERLLFGRVGVRSTVMLRCPTFRSNLRYRIERVDVENGLDPNGIPKDLLHSVSVKSREIAPDEKIVVYCKTKAETVVIAKELGCEYYNGDLTEQQKREVLHRWLTLDSHKVIVATVGGLGNGIDHAKVRYTYHVWPWTNTMCYAQESGRGARDGRPGTSFIFCKPKNPSRNRKKKRSRRLHRGLRHDRSPPYPDSSSDSDSDGDMVQGLRPDRMEGVSLGQSLLPDLSRLRKANALAVKDFFNGTGCLRIPLTRFLDGWPVDCASLRGEWCSNCKQEVTPCTEPILPLKDEDYVPPLHDAESLRQITLTQMGRSYAKQKTAACNQHISSSPPLITLASGISPMEGVVNLSSENESPEDFSSFIVPDSAPIDQVSDETLLSENFSSIVIPETSPVVEASGEKLPSSDFSNLIVTDSAPAVGGSNEMLMLENISNIVETNSASPGQELGGTIISETFSSFVIPKSARAVEDSSSSRQDVIASIRASWCSDEGHQQSLRPFSSIVPDPAAVLSDLPSDWPDTYEYLTGSDFFMDGCSQKNLQDQTYAQDEEVSGGNLGGAFQEVDSNLPANSAVDHTEPPVSLHQPPFLLTEDVQYCGTTSNGSVEENIMRSPDYGWATGMSSQVQWLMKNVEDCSDIRNPMTLARPPPYGARRPAIPIPQENLPPLSQLYEQTQMTDVGKMNTNFLRSNNPTPLLPPPSLDDVAQDINGSFHQTDRPISTTDYPILLPSSLTFGTSPSPCSSLPSSGNVVSSVPPNPAPTITSRPPSAPMHHSSHSFLSSRAITSNKQRCELFSQWSDIIQPFINRCPLCYYQNYDASATHTWAEKSNLEKSSRCGVHPSFSEFIQWKKRWLSPSIGKRFEKYSCCYNCYLPYDLCRKMNDSVVCEGKSTTSDIVLPLVFMSQIFDDLRPSQADIHYPHNQDEFLQWLRASVPGLGVKATNCFIFSMAVARKMMRGINRS
jgi:hypothetical protein